MKVVYQDGQKFIITDSLYEARKKSGLVSNPQQPQPNFETPQNANTQDGVNNNVNVTNPQEQQLIQKKKRYPSIPFGKTKDEYGELYKDAMKGVKDEFVNTILKDSDIDWGNYTQDGVNKSIAFYSADGIIKDLSKDSVGKIIKKSIQDDKSIDPNNDDSIIAQMKLAMKNYVKQSASGENKEKFIADAYVRTKSLISNSKLPSVRGSIQQTGKKAKNVITQAISSVLGDINNEDSTNFNSGDNQEQLPFSTSTDGNLDNHTIIVKYYSKFGKNKKRIISFGKQQNAIQQALGLSQGSFGQSIVTSKMNIVVGQDNIKITFSTQKDVDINDILQKNIIPSCIQVAKEVGGVFNSQPNIVININVDNVTYDDISIDDADTTKGAFQAIHTIVQSKDYEINAIVQDLINDITQNITDKDDIQQYNEGINKINERLNIVYKNLYQSQIDEEMIFQCLNAIEDATQKEGTSTKNDIVVNAIENVFNPQPIKDKKSEQSAEQPTEQSAEQPSEQSAEQSSEQPTEQPDKYKDIKEKYKKLFQLYKFKKMLDGLKITDYYAMDGFAENIKIESAHIMGKFGQLQDIMGVEKRNVSNTKFVTDETSLYPEYVYVDVFSNVCDGLLATELDNVPEKDMKEIKKAIKQIKSDVESKLNNNSLWDALRHNENLKRFVSIMGRYPRSKDKEGYRKVYELIKVYGKEIQKAGDLLIKGLADFGIFKQEIDIRNVKVKDFNKILKIDSIKDTKFKDAIAYASLTKFKKDIEQLREDRPEMFEFKGSSSTGVKKLVQLVEGIVDTSTPLITDDFVAGAVLKEVLIFTNINMQDVIGGMKENDDFLAQFKTGKIRYGEEGAGNRVYTVPILSNRLKDACIGVFRIRKIFARTRDAANKLFNHDFFKTIFDDFKNL